MTSMRCPKCNWEQPEAAACRKCGLTRDRMDAFVANAGEGRLAAAWAAVDADWSRQGAHDALIASGLAHGELPGVARLYAQAARTRSSESERADARTRADAVGKMAQAALWATAAPRPEKADPRFKRLALVALATVMLLLLAVVATFMLGERQEAATRRQPTIRSW